MNFSSLAIGEKLVPHNYLKLAIDAQKSKETLTKELLEKCTLPTTGWSDEHIEELVRQLAALDSNNFSNKSGLGEREARIACKLVARRHYNFGHGIGRSGDLLEPQPKAAGSTLLANLVNALLLQLIRAMGVRSCSFCFLVPMATGMTLNLCMLALKKQRPQAKYVIWSRIDQKSCFKSITSAGLIPIIVDQIPKLGIGEALCTDLETIQSKLLTLNAADILCIFSTTSCFAPRCCDDIIALAKLAVQYNVPHLVNNAYGLQSTYLTHQLEQAQREGRVDLFVQSTDKNLMVPVGGAIVAGFDKTLVRSVAKTYAGRASSSQSLDVLMTLLSLGKNGFKQYIDERKANYEYLRNKMMEFAVEHNETFIARDNSISLALTLKTLLIQSTDTKQSLSQLGSMLYTRGISGVRVLSQGDNREIDGYAFQNWGTHTSSINVPYLTVAASIGLTQSEIDMFIKKLNNCWNLFMSRNGDVQHST